MVKARSLKGSRRAKRARVSSPGVGEADVWWRTQNFSDSERTMQINNGCCPPDGAKREEVDSTEMPLDHAGSGRRREGWPSLVKPDMAGHDPGEEADKAAAPRHLGRVSSCSTLLTP